MCLLAKTHCGRKSTVQSKRWIIAQVTAFLLIINQSQEEALSGHSMQSMAVFIQLCAAFVSPLFLCIQFQL